jgi:D-glycero-alpha-D-manno-heptose-7-phosphate kinase
MPPYANADTFIKVLTDGGKVRSRAPLRLGLAGGGTDVSPYSEDFGGAVLNATIDRYAFTLIEWSVEPRVRFVAADLEIDESYPLDLSAIAQAKLRLHAAVYRRIMTQFNGGRLLPLIVRTSVDAPAGSGLGSSSSLVVALVEAYCAALAIPLGPYDVAHLAFEIERLDLALVGGKQDQYAAAFGGINFIEFMANDRVIVNPLRISRSILNEFETSLVTCFSGISRSSMEIIEQQRQGMTEKAPRAIEGLHQLKVDAVEMKLALCRGNIRQMAEILTQSWQAKKKTAPGISTAEIERLYQTAIGNGAWAGKVSGAGGGGFIMFIVPPEARIELIRALNAAGGQASGVKFSSKGAESWIV